jgi:D-alanyl-lipoteichoic acid acyltransferase DltB (MBOAT superfamily)
VNLLILGFFKYFNFFAEVLETVTGAATPRLDIALPLGISFFTFHHIMYLVDLRAGRAPRFDLVRYGLYIAFFPQILAGPLVRWHEIMHQFDERPYARPDAAERFARGIMLLIVGLGKKVLLGDPLSEYVTPVYAAAGAGTAVTGARGLAGDARLPAAGAISTFSGYTDMALGIGLMFGILLPQNFDVPYRGTSLQDYWRRWHITLSRFLRDYLYIAMGGNRHGLAVQIGAIVATMTLAGLWHGAGLTYVVFGVLHGVGLAAGMLWRRAGFSMPPLLGWATTMIFVWLGLVIFRAPSLEAAMTMYKAIFGFAEMGQTMKWRSLAIGAPIAVLGPTAWALVHAVPPWRVMATACAAAFVLVLFKIGDDANYEFIYFQF